MSDDNHQEICARVRQLIGETFGVPAGEVAADMAYGDLPQWDSLGHMDVMMALETQFGVEISTETIAELVSVEAICSYIERNGHV
jgi:acyl carrier protein